ncbi:MAG TPA: hybrid sensor histidine kinase/response regulator, partial [Cyanobacteria bacterium UBA12227]|nr:hybrid sensor histidine kinase/response regulator [Cyanobacteria bacterium UBA12227]
WLVIAQDTTEQKQVAKELAAKNADLVQLNRLKDEFLACISHELKTPLTAVLGLSTLLKDQALGELNERQARYARLIYQSGRQLMSLVNDILDLTRIETGQLELTLEPVQIEMVCDRAYAQARQVYLDKDQQNEGFAPEISFTLEIEPGLDTIIADELRLRQMLVHLLSNALKFTDTDSTIGLRVNALEGWIAFTVWDTGIGIPAEKQHLIFQKFQQLEEPLTRRFEGTGLGLVLTQRLARLHGGEVSFISKSGEGSEFTLLLPPSPPQSSNLSNLTDWGRERSRNRLILIVETVVRYLEDLTTQLKSLGYWVVVARSGTEAIEKARSLQPCTILLNPLLPQLSGWDVLTLLKSDVQTRHIPVLIAATQAEKAQAYAHNADGFLSLPVQKQALVQNLPRLSKPHSQTKTALTILYLSGELGETPSDSSRLIAQLTEVLSIRHSELNYQVLEADDLDQAELLAQVWHPDVILLDGSGIVEPLTYLKNLSFHKGLTSVPIVTLDRRMSQAANHIIGLSVYPCLAPDNQNKITALLDVIQVAAGLTYKSSILVMEIDQRNGTKDLSPSLLSHSLKSYTPWLQALIQFLQTAGFRSLLSSSWVDVYRQLQDRTVDLLLIRLKNINNSADLIKGLIGLGELPNLPSILVLDHRVEAPTLDQMERFSGDYNPELESQLRAVATQILQGHSYSMNELLDHIHQALAK